MGSCHSCFNSADRIEVRILAEGTFALVVIVAEQGPSFVQALGKLAEELDKGFVVEEDKERFEAVGG